MKKHKLPLWFHKGLEFLFGDGRAKSWEDGVFAFLITAGFVVTVAVTLLFVLGVLGVW